MDTPRPMRAIRNSTMMLTEVICVRPLTSRKVVGMATIAMSMGRTAMKLAKTNASTNSAPMPPSRVSVRALFPLLDPPLSSCPMPVTPVCHLAGAAAAAAAVKAGVWVSRNPLSSGVKMSPKLIWPAEAEKWASPVLAWSASRDPGTAAAAAINTRLATAGEALCPAGAVTATTVGAPLV